MDNGVHGFDGSPSPRLSNPCDAVFIFFEANMARSTTWTTRTFPAGISSPAPWVWG